MAAEFFNLKTDPGETEDIIAAHPELAESMAAQFMGLIGSGPGAEMIRLVSGRRE